MTIDELTIQEEAFKRGYDKGRADAIAAEKKTIRGECKIDTHATRVAELEDENAALKEKLNLIDHEIRYQNEQRRILEAQMDVVRLIFGKGVYNG